MSSQESKLFTPINVGRMSLKHRNALAPLTRFRANISHTPILPIVESYYAQRASTPGTLLITEATFINAQSGGYDHVPGVWEPAHRAAWKRITDAVHARGSYIVLQLWALGRVASAKVMRRAGLDVISSSAVKAEDDHVTPREMAETEIWAQIGSYALSAKWAIEECGFDGVEIHAAHGYLIDQFTQDTCNKRTDQWGGSIENRTRFALEIAKACVAAIGKERVGIRLSPYTTFQGMGMQDPLPTFTYLIKELRSLDLMYLHLTTPRVNGGKDISQPQENLDWAVNIWGTSSPVILTGGFNPATAKEEVDEKFKDFDLLIGWGRHFIANPDLPYRLKNKIKFNKYNRSTFYTAESPTGYIDYPFSDTVDKKLDLSHKL